ncbi:hypothetical protein [Mesorhizobium sp.]|uniref:hypothetical protein n=1 Tax=Mesorhizobium sp. TaxID=1871066 RepID=UPI0025B87A3A|nr:hypothetical protein [Mesorhizobium sp.]
MHAIERCRRSGTTFFFHLVLITSDNLKTLPQGLTVFVGELATDRGVVHRADTGGAADYVALHRVVEAVHFRHQGAIK